MNLAGSVVGVARNARAEVVHPRPPPRPSVPLWPNLFAGWEENVPTLSQLLNLPRRGARDPRELEIWPFLAPSAPSSGHSRLLQLPPLFPHLTHVTHLTDLTPSIASPSAYFAYSAVSIAAFQAFRLSTPNPKYSGTQTEEGRISQFSCLSCLSWWPRTPLIFLATFLPIFL
jgi:hypothetical protein